MNFPPEMREKLDKDQLIVFETCVDYAISIKKLKKNTGYSIKPPLIVVQGGAGSGKSFVIEAISQHMEKILSLNMSTKEQNDGSLSCIPLFHKYPKDLVHGDEI